MFNLRRHHFQSLDGLNRQTLLEEFLHWAARINSLDSDSIKLTDIERTDFDDDSIIVVNGEYFENKSVYVKSEGGVIGALNTTFNQYNGPGEYYVCWNVDGYIRNDETWWIEGIPFLGETLFVTASAREQNPTPFNPYFAAQAAYGTPQYFFPEDFRFSLCGAGVSIISNDSVNCGLTVMTNQTGKIEIKRGALSICKRVQ